jgi:hypothetical protein
MPARELGSIKKADASRSGGIRLRKEGAKT